ncbi:MAG: GNAT family N-acetyltransferase [Flavobacteriia bacterium]|nr:MAG: GNAT family N-acetyltransferase [Flavobacteriia bacterium]
MSYKLRNATPGDMISVLDLIHELAEFENQPNAVEITVNDLIKDGYEEGTSFRVIVAEKNNDLVGMALFYPRYSTWKGRSLHLEDLIVKKEFRGKGIGNALYTSVLKYADQNGYKRVAWEVLDWNKVAIDFYISTGARVFDDWRVAHIDEKAIKNYLKKTNS